MMLKQRNRRNVEKHQFVSFAEGDPEKRKQCLGPDCKKWIMATKKIRLCTYCRKKITEIEGESGVFIEPPSGGSE